MKQLISRRFGASRWPCNLSELIGSDSVWPNWCYFIFLVSVVSSCNKPTGNTVDPFSFSGLKLGYPLDSVKNVFNSGPDSPEISQDSSKGITYFTRSTIREFDSKNLDVDPYFNQLSGNMNRGAGEGGRVRAELKDNKLVLLSTSTDHSSKETYSRVITIYKKLYGPPKIETDTTIYWSGEDSELQLEYAYWYAIRNGPISRVDANIKYLLKAKD